MRATGTGGATNWFENNETFRAEHARTSGRIMANPAVLAWAMAAAIAGGLASSMAVAQSESESDEAVMAIVKTGQAGLFRKAGGKIATRVLIEGETVYVDSATPTDGYLSVTLDDERTKGWMKVKDLQIIGQRPEGNVVKSQ